MVNRQTILASIHRHLRESLAETGDVRPLGEIVSRVAGEIRSSDGSRLSETLGTSRTPRQVLPIEQVAAFVDGGLTPAEIDQVRNAVMVDNSVLAELVAAVRTRQESAESLPPLSDALTEQLLAMQAELPAQHQEPPRSGAAANPPIGVDRSTVVPAPTPLEIVASTTQNGRVQRRPYAPIRGWKIVGWIALAASILAILAFSVRDRQSVPSDNDVAQRDPDALQRDGQRRLDPAIDVDPGVIEQKNLMVGVESSQRPSGSDPSRPRESMVPEVPQPDFTPADSTPIDSVVQDDAAGEKPAPRPLTAGSLDRDPPETPSLAPPPRLPAMRWKEITGLLAQRELSSTSPVIQRIGGWKSISENASDTSGHGRLALRTLPLSRAEAELDGGGRIVIAADSELQLSRATSKASADIELQHGSVAIIDVPEGTVINLVLGDQVVASLRWNDHASAVVQRDAAGFEVHVHHGTIDVNDVPRQDESVSVASDRSIASIDRPKRLPNWVDRPTDTIGIPRHILAQIADTDDVMRTLNQRISELGTAARLSSEDQRVLSTLATWQAAMADVQLFRMVNSRIPAMRLAALQRLVSLPQSDPRFVPVWKNVERMAANRQRVAQIRRWCEMARGGIRPNPAQVEQMITGLSAQDVGSRAMADYMLRQFFTGGPPFDPTWTGQPQQRAINVWRKRVGLPATARAATTNAAPGN